jgi:hypothetical protein
MFTRSLNDVFDPDYVAECRSQVNRSYPCVPRYRGIQPFIDEYPRPTLIKDTTAEPRDAFKSLIPTTQYLSIKSTKMTSLHSIETRHFISNQVSPHIYKLLDLLIYKSFISISTHLIPAINIQSATPPPTKSSPPSTKQTQQSTPPSPQHEKHSKAHGVPIPAQRAKCMLKFGDLLEERAEQFVHLDPLCMGIDPVLVKHVLIPAYVEAFRCK